MLLIYHGWSASGCPCAGTVWRRYHPAMGSRLKILIDSVPHKNDPEPMTVQRTHGVGLHWLPPLPSPWLPSVVAGLLLLPSPLPLSLILSLLLWELFTWRLPVLITKGPFNHRSQILALLTGNKETSYLPGKKKIQTSTSQISSMKLIDGWELSFWQLANCSWYINYVLTRAVWGVSMQARK